MFDEQALTSHSLLEVFSEDLLLSGPSNRAGKALHGLPPNTFPLYLLAFPSELLVAALPCL